MVMQYRKASLDTLPSEILENILIVVVAIGDAESVAAVASTCKALFNTVYRATDKHLWRSFFCITFDDPRILHWCAPNDYDWRTNFQDRVRSRRFVVHHAKPIRILDRRGKPHFKDIYTLDELPNGDQIAQMRALRALSSVISTAAPAGHHAEFSRTTVARTDRSGTSRLVDLVQLHHQTPLSLKSADSGWDASQEGLAMGALISHLGFLPMPSTGPGEIGAPVSHSTRFRRRARRSSDSAGLVDMSEQAQWNRALWLARERVFDINYLSPRRSWGPYLPVRLHAALAEGELGETSAGDSDDDSDPDYVPDGDPARDIHVPPAGQLFPDWSWLAAARIVASRVLRAHYSLEIIRKLETWENLREGTWSILEKPSDAANDACTSRNQANEVNHLGREAEQTASVVAERDWAGVEGVWRRLVCWLDYHDLLCDCDDPDLDEAWTIVPLSLRITGYSPSPVADFADRPTIHVEGEMGGAWWQGDVDAETEDIRRVHGTVSMLPDGHVRWSITSMKNENTEDEWASEAVQLGGIGSAMGSLGMWSGLSRDVDDPLGVIWQWRVG
ncbi:hypothetical protein BD414DRAFT_504186 [Trametes punicea]|nr:hypothetical protein BD414DRAFT_504186 [Trametes punicea]